MSLVGGSCLRPSSAGTPDARVATLEVASFVLGHSTPNSVVLAGVDSPFQAGPSDLTATANGLRFSCLEKRRAGVPSGKNRSGSSPKQAARLRQLTIVVLLESRSGKSAPIESLQGTERTITTRSNAPDGVDNPSRLKAKLRGSISAKCSKEPGPLRKPCVPWTCPEGDLPTWDTHLRHLAPDLALCLQSPEQRKCPKVHRPTAREATGEGCGS